MNEIKAAAGLVQGFLEDAKPFMDLLKAEGYFTESMELTDKGKEVLRKYYEKHLTR
jgi:predicted transcriptional regulator